MFQGYGTGLEGPQTKRDKLLLYKYFIHTFGRNINTDYNVHKFQVLEQYYTQDSALSALYKRA